MYRYYGIAIFLFCQISMYKYVSVSSYSHSSICPSSYPRTGSLTALLRSLLLPFDHSHLNDPLALHNLGCAPTAQSLQLSILTQLQLSNELGSAPPPLNVVRYGKRQCLLSNWIPKLGVSHQNFVPVSVSGGESFSTQFCSSVMIFVDAAEATSF